MLQLVGIQYGAVFVAGDDEVGCVVHCLHFQLRGKYFIPVFDEEQVTVFHYLPFSGGEAFPGLAVQAPADGFRQAFVEAEGMKYFVQQGGRCCLVLQGFDVYGPSVVAQDTCAAFVYTLSVNEGSVGQVGGSFQEIVFGGRIYLLHERKQVEADFVAQVFVFQVGAVRHVVLTQALQVIGNFPSVEAQKGADDVPVAWTDALQAVEAGAAQKVEQEGFGAVITMVGHGDGLCALFLP